MVGHCRGVPVASSSQSYSLAVDCKDLQDLRGLLDLQGPLHPAVSCPGSCPAWRGKRINDHYKGVEQAGTVLLEEPKKQS